MPLITWSDEEVDALKKMYKEGFRANEIAIVLNERFHNGEDYRSGEQVRKKAYRLGIKSPYAKKEKDGLYYCGHCKKYLDIDAFKKNVSKPYGIGSICKPCEIKYRNRRIRLNEILEKLNVK